MIIWVLSYGMFLVVVGDKYTDCYLNSGSGRMVGMGDPCLSKRSKTNCSTKLHYILLYSAEFWKSFVQQQWPFHARSECYQWVVVWDKIGDVLLFWGRMRVQSTTSKKISIVFTRSGRWVRLPLSAEQLEKRVAFIFVNNAPTVRESSQIIFVFSMRN